ncbi:hypothetical protein, partial [Thermofilum sp.]|uniref:hypothetical protein n=1 Tax=Thermofilum sp. TaxID=1961369 RepID=UPI00258C4F74
TSLHNLANAWPSLRSGAPRDGSASGQEAVGFAHSPSASLGTWESPICQDLLADAQAFLLTDKLAWSKPPYAKKPPAVSWP